MDNELKTQQLIQDMPAARKAVRLVWDEVRRYGGTEAEITISSAIVVYKFCSHDGRCGEGSVNARYASAITSALMESFRLTFGLDAVDVVGVGNGVFRLSLAKREEIATVTPMLSLVKSNDGIDKSGVSDDALAHTMLPTILVVEDNPTFSKVLVRFLGRQGFVVTVCGDGREAIEKLESGFVPDLIMSDLHMPHLNGDELASKVRSIAALEHTPLLLLTSDRSIETELKALEIGVDLFLSKSEDPRLIAAYAKRLLKRAAAPVVPQQLPEKAAAC